MSNQLYDLANRLEAIRGYVMRTQHDLDVMPEESKTEETTDAEASLSYVSRVLQAVVHDIQEASPDFSVNDVELGLMHGGVCVRRMRRFDVDDQLFVDEPRPGGFTPLVPEVSHGEE